MRRFFVFVVSSLIGVSLFAPSASAGTYTRETYSAQGFYASFGQRQRIDSDSYYRIRWYVSAYDSFEDKDERFRAYVSRYVSQCDVVTNSRVRCHTVSRLSGVRQSPSAVNFVVDKDLTTASMSGTWTLKQVKNHVVVDTKTVQVSASLTARGTTSRSRETYTTWEGNCPRSRYRFTYEYTRAFADVTITGDLEASATGLKSASIWQNDGFVKHRKC
jgi:hypothetical protein